jgi:uncharacterized phage protein (TIGR01671 family)
MREIKFRVWSKEHRKMLHFDGGGLLQEYHQLCFGWSDEDEDDDWPGEYNSLYMSDCELMQYTGMSDKTGGEVYEGDIVEADPELGSCWRLGEVRFTNGAFRVHGYVLIEAVKHLTVIGNLYENPELLGVNHEEKV